MLLLLSHGCVLLAEGPCGKVVPRIWTLSGHTVKALPEADEIPRNCFVFQWNIGQPKGGCCVLIVSVFCRERIVHICFKWFPLSMYWKILYWFASMILLMSYFWIYCRMSFLVELKIARRFETAWQYFPMFTPSTLSLSVFFLSQTPCFLLPQSSCPAGDFHALEGHFS